jgi:hypothetical protein
MARFSKEEKAALAAERKYIKDVEAALSSLKFLGNGKVTSGDLEETFDRLKLPRTGRLFAALLMEAVDNGLEIVEGESTRKPSVPTEELFGDILAHA